MAQIVCRLRRFSGKRPRFAFLASEALFVCFRVFRGTSKVNHERLETHEKGLKERKEKRGKRQESASVSRLLLPKEG